MLMGDYPNCHTINQRDGFKKSVPDSEMDQHLFAGNFKR